MGPGPQTWRIYTAFSAGGQSKIADSEKDWEDGISYNSQLVSEVGSTEHSSWADTRELVGVCGRFRLYGGPMDCYYAVLHTDFTRRAFRVQCSQRQHCANALRTDSSNSRFATKSCACVSTAFVACIISWCVESTTVRLQSSVSWCIHLPYLLVTYPKAPPVYFTLWSLIFI